MKSYVLLIIAGWLCSCASHSDTFYDLTSSKQIKPNKVICEVLDAGVLSQLQIDDTLLVAIDHLGEKKFIVIDLNSGKEISRLGEKGRGPKEFYSPQFVINDNTIIKDSSYLSVYDSNLMRFFHIDFNKLVYDSTYRIPSQIFPVKIIGCTNLNLLKDKIIGKSSTTEDSGAFFIYDTQNERQTWADYYPRRGNLKPGTYNYLYNVNLAANEATHKIICGMTFMDIVTVYDTTGHLIKSYKFSENTTFDIDSDTQMVKYDAPVYLPHIYSTRNHCYFLRIGYDTGSLDARKDGTTLIKLDWEGNIVNSYKINEYLYGFCIDEQRDKLLGIFSEDSDVFKILEYNL